MRIHSTDDEDVGIMDLSQALDRAEDIDLSTHVHTGEIHMAKLQKTAPQAAAAPAPAAPAKKTKAAASPAPAETKTEEPTGGPRGVPEGHVGLAALADKFGTSPAAMRRRLRGSDISKPADAHGWYFKEGSKELAAVEKLFAEPEPAAK